MGTEDSEHFYARLKPFHEFRDLANLANYVALPPDWHVVITDVRDSTTAIQSGRYKDVNILGAASITAILNAVRPLPIPYVFGGDGSSLCVPSTRLGVVRDALLSTKRLAAEQFGLTLRVGIVPAPVIQQSPYQVLVARHRVSRYYIQAMFTGGGLGYAEKLVKFPKKSELPKKEVALRRQEVFGFLEAYVARDYERAGGVDSLETRMSEVPYLVKKGDRERLKKLRRKAAERISDEALHEIEYLTSLIQYAYTAEE